MVIFTHTLTRRPIKITNEGSCPIYGLEVRTTPPDREWFSNSVAYLGALLGVSSTFRRKLGTLERGDSTSFAMGDLLNSDGKKLSDDYVIGSWVFTGSYCGKSASVVYTENK